MIKFTPLSLGDKEKIDRYLMNGEERGCEYSFANLYLWGRQKAAFVNDNLVLLSQYTRRSAYPFPIGPGDPKPAIDAILQDAEARGIPCRLSSVTNRECELLQKLYPGELQIEPDRDSFDYVYDINDLADLKGKKFQKKRNHLHRFLDAYPDYETEPLTEKLMPDVVSMVQQWYADREKENPDMDYSLEKKAIFKAMECRTQLQMEGLAILNHGEVLAMTMGSRLQKDTFDVHFEKAASGAELAYPAINWEFARYIRARYPEVKYLNREDDMGIDGLRRAKNSYNPHHMVEKNVVCLTEDGCGQNP